MRLLIASLALFMWLAPAASAEPTGTPVDPPVDSPVCSTYFPSDFPSGPFTDSEVVETATAEPAPDVSGGDEATGAAGSDEAIDDVGDTEEPTDVIDTEEPTDVIDTEEPTDVIDTEEPTDIPSGPITVCAQAAEGGAGGGAAATSETAPVHGDALSNSGSDPGEFVGLAAAMLVLGVGLSVLGGRRRTRRSH